MANDRLHIGRHVLALFRVFVDKQGNVETYEGHNDEMPQMCCLFFIKGRSRDFQRDAAGVQVNKEVIAPKGLSRLAHAPGGLHQ